MIDPKQLRDYVILPTFRLFPDKINTPASVELVLGTIFQESECGQYIHQLNGGPALSICQIEPASANDLFSWISKQPELYVVLRSVMTPQSIDEQLVGNLAFAVAMCRLYYWRVPAPLAAAGDIQGHARYWKSWYNTAAGAGTIQQYMANWAKFSPYLG